MQSEGREYEHERPPDAIRVRRCCENWLFAYHKGGCLFIRMLVGTVRWNVPWSVLLLLEQPVS
jgi:hypothetical protein